MSEGGPPRSRSGRTHAARGEDSVELSSLCPPFYLLQEIGRRGREREGEGGRRSRKG